MRKFEEVVARYHEGVAKAAVVGVVLDFFGEDVGGVNDAGDMFDVGVLCGLGFTDLVLAEVDVFGAFVGESGGPIARGLVVVVDGRGSDGIVHA